MNNTTQAIVEPGAQLISGGGIDVSALDDLTRIGINGSLAKSQSSVVGVSLGVNVVSRDTEAYIGTGYSGGTLLAAGNANTIVTAAGPIAIGATTPATSGQPRSPGPTPPALRPATQFPETACSSSTPRPSFCNSWD